jgi:spore coat polysaccharide biosynthesis protein SpsF
MLSTRLERKVLRDLAGVPMIAHVLGRASRFPEVMRGAGVVMAIPEGRADDELAAFGENRGVNVFRGDEEDVLSRLLLAAESVGADVVYRVTADNPLVDPGVVEATWSRFLDGEWDYAVMDGTPLGTTAEVVSVEALKRVRELATTPTLREHPTLALYENSDQFRMRLLKAPEAWRHPEWRFTVDTEEDLALVETILLELGHEASLEAIVPFLERNPQLARINASVGQKGWEGLKERKDAIGGAV